MTTDVMFRQAVLDGLVRLGHDKEARLYIMGNSNAPRGRRGWQPLAKNGRWRPWSCYRSRWYNRPLVIDEWNRLTAATPEQVAVITETPNVEIFGNPKDKRVTSVYIIDGMTLVLFGWSVREMLHRTLGIDVPPWKGEK